MNQSTHSSVANIVHALEGFEIAFLTSQLDEISSGNALLVEILKALTRFVAHPAGTSVSAAAEQLANDIDPKSLVVDPALLHEEEAFKIQFIADKPRQGNRDNPINALGEMLQFAYRTSVDCAHIDQAKVTVRVPSSNAGYCSLEFDQGALLACIG